MPATEPVLAAVYKVLVHIDNKIEIEDRKGASRWSVTNSVRRMLGQKPNHNEGVTYQEMRDWISDFLERHNIP